MACPNGHKGGAFCCEDYVNQWFASALKRHKNQGPVKTPSIPTTLKTWEYFRKMLKEQEDEQR